MNKKCYALVLAGGKSSRMGTDKAKLNIDGKPVLERAADFWKTSGRVEKVLISVGPGNHFDSLPEETDGITDLIEGRGPMAGIWSAFKSTDAEILYVSAVDMPNLTHDMILPPPGEETDCAVYVMNGRPEPLFGVYRRSTMEIMEKLLLAGEGKLGRVFDLAKTEFAEVPCGKEKTFDNLNRPEDLERFRQCK